MSPAEATDEGIGASAKILRRKGERFVIATVVRTTGATAAKPGAKALVLEDGTIREGWIGGGCVQSALGRAAREAIADGNPKLISLLPSDLLETRGIEPGATQDGVRFARTNCPSNGSMDIFVEPVLPKPALVFFGASPVALALTELSSRFDWTISRKAAADPLPPSNSAHRRMIVIASQGQQDLECLRSALSSRAEYIGFVGSRRKFKALSEALIAEGEDAALLAHVHAPAGLAIDAVTPDEIALSILAELVQVRRRGHRECHRGKVTEITP
ncbi:MAG: XdhC family protein [Pseudomonadota bacterium]